MIGQPKKDRIGHVFGRLTVVALAHRRIYSSGRSQYEWHCRCSCGTEKVIAGTALASGLTVSCGCFLREQITVHGQSKSKEYWIWAGMLKRCNTPSSPSYKDYGGRGIKVCKRWFEFRNFIADMGLRPVPSLTIERCNVNGDYEPSNCVWATRSNQNRNKRVSPKSASGVHGVTWDNRRSKWMSRVILEGGQGLFLGRFSILEEAVSARKVAEQKFSLYVGVHL